MTTVTSNDIQELKDLLSAMRQENREQISSLREETRKQIDTLKEDNRQQIETLREENNKQFINLHKEITEVKIITAKIEGTIQSQAVLTQKIPDLVERLTRFLIGRSPAQVVQSCSLKPRFFSRKTGARQNFAICLSLLIC